MHYIHRRRLGSVLAAVAALLFACTGGETTDPDADGGTTTDTTAPSAPTNLAVTGATGSSVSLSWTASTDNVGVTSYEVLNGTSVAKSVTTTAATVTGLSPETSYSFTVRAKDAAGNVSAASSAVAVSTTASGGSGDTGNTTGWHASDYTGPVRQEVYPTVPASSCSENWPLSPLNTCCAEYCDNDDRSEGCGPCGGSGSPHCVQISGKACISGAWPEIHNVTKSEPWHFSRSTHYGLLPTGGACGLGKYALCTTKSKNASEACAKFCEAYPDLCADPPGVSLRGNIAAPQGNYYTQFWSSLPGDRDNYLSCGECFEVVRTKQDGSDYQPGEPGYTPSVVLTITDSCPCSANQKWCCGAGRDHCGEIKTPQFNYVYGCPLPIDPPDAPTDRDPYPSESIHLDLSDMAMSRLQTGDPDGAMVDGVIPTRYRRVPCPVVGNIHLYYMGGGPYWFSLNVVNVSGPGSVIRVEAKLPSGSWVDLTRDPNFSSFRPQERYGPWVLPQGAGPFDLPVTLRVTIPGGRSLELKDALKSWEVPSTALQGDYFIDTGKQF